MATEETRILNKIRVALSGLVVTFRNHVGVIKDENGVVHRFGLCKGSSDLVGWKTIVITPDMIGRDVAVFLAIEVKTSTGRPSKEQRFFIDAVQEAGGISGIARSDEEALEIVNRVPGRD